MPMDPGGPMSVCRRRISTNCSAQTAAIAREYTASGGALCAIARANNPRADGVAMSVVTELPPADSPKTRHPAGVAAERADVAAHPPQRRDLIAQSEVRLDPAPRGGVAGEVEVAERAEPVVEADVDDLAGADEVAPLSAEVPRGPGAVTAAVDEHHDRQRRPVRRFRGRGDDVDGQAVLPGGHVRGDTGELALVRLHRDLAERRGVAESLPGNDSRRRPEAQPTDRRRCIRNAAPRDGAAFTDAADDPTRHAHVQ